MTSLTYIKLWVFEKKCDIKNNPKLISYLLDFLTPLKDSLSVIVPLCVQLICSSGTHVLGSLWFLLLCKIERIAQSETDLKYSTFIKRLWLHKNLPEYECKKSKHQNH